MGDSRWRMLLALFALVGLFAAGLPARAHEIPVHGHHWREGGLQGCVYGKGHYNWGGGGGGNVATAYTEESYGCDTVGVRMRVVTAGHFPVPGDHKYKTTSWVYSGSQAYVSVNTWDWCCQPRPVWSQHRVESSSTGRWSTTYINY